jgi:shikimate kinase
VNSDITPLDLPYTNLILVGFVGVGKTTLGKHIAERVGVDFVDLDDEIETREEMPIGQIRQVYSEAHLRLVEHELCHEASLRRRVVIVVSGAAMLDERNYDLLSQTGQIVCLVCELGEALRRLHMADEERFRDVKRRGYLIGQLRRESPIVEDKRLLQLDTTHLTVEYATEALLHLWRTGKPADDSAFHQGPPHRPSPPPRRPTGLSGREPRGRKPPDNE